jgi:predicted RNA-binding Zn-ribbon protein involved in translation (DUF1610 family)
MDNVERMFRHLVRTIRSRFPQYVAQPFDVAQLHQEILPFRHHRRELGLDSNEEYEITLMELLATDRGFLVVDDRMREALRTELATKNPDPSAFRQFGSAHVSLSPEAVQMFQTGANPAVTEPAGIRASSPGMGQPVVAVRQPSPVATPAGVTPLASSVVPEDGERCRSCGEELPVGRAITFCPHCGVNATTMNCTACGAELDMGWKYCPVCGRPAGSRRGA